MDQAVPRLVQYFHKHGDHGSEFGKKPFNTTLKQSRMIPASIADLHLALQGLANLGH